MMSSEKEYYEENGYILFKNVITDEKIDFLLEEFEKFKKKGKIYYSQSHHHWRSCLKDVDQFGLLTCSIENFTHLLWAKTLSNLGLNILLSNQINEFLKLILDHNEFCMWQNMFFDKSVGTVDHFDSWYLDTDPPGSLIGAWFALEDIDGKGGTFHIYPHSHKIDFSQCFNYNHDEFIKFSTDKAKKFDKFELKIQKGDVLFWHPNLIHGSSSQNTEGYSRKSLTAHYFPINYKKCLGGYRGKKSDSNSESYKNSLREQMKFVSRYSHKIYTKKFRYSYKDSVQGFIKYYTNYKNTSHWVMNRQLFK